MYQIRKVAIGLAAILIISLFMVSYAPVPTSASSPKAIKLRYSSGLPPTHQVSYEQKWFADEVQKRTGGRIIVELYTGAELYTHWTVLDAVIAGGIEMGLNSHSHWGGKNPVFHYPNYFFLIQDADHWLKAREAVRAIIEPLFEKLNAKHLHFWSYGASGLISRRPIEEPSDFKGLVIRGPTKAHFEQIKLLGGTPAAMSAAEAYDAIAKGAIDGTFTGWSTMYTRKQYEVAEYFIGPFWYSVWGAFINLNTWKKLPKDIQNVILEVAKETEARSLEAEKKFDKEALEALRTKGTLKVFTSKEMEVWARVMEPVYDIWLKSCRDAGYGAEGRQLYDAIMKAAK